MKVSSVMSNKFAAFSASMFFSGAVILLTTSSAFCAQGVEKKMKAQAATDKVFVSLNKKVTLVALKEGQDIPDETIKSKITNAGYVVKGISRTSESFDQLRAKIKASK